MIYHHSTIVAEGANLLFDLLRAYARILTKREIDNDELLQRFDMLYPDIRALTDPEDVAGLEEQRRHDRVLKYPTKAERQAAAQGKLDMNPEVIITQPNERRVLRELCQLLDDLPGYIRLGHGEDIRGYLKRVKNYL